MQITSKHRPFRWIVLASCIVLFGARSATHAAVLAYDDLEEAVLGSLGGQVSGTGFSAGYALASGASCAVANESLSYSNGVVMVEGGTNCAVIGYQKSSSVFFRAIPSWNGDDLYLSFLFRTPTGDGKSNEDFLSFGLSTAIGEPTAGVVHRYNATSTDHDFGIRTSSDTDIKGNFTTEPDRTYFIVLRLHKLTPGATANFNELSLFVDPDSMYEPVPTLVVTNTGWAAPAYLNARIANAETGDTYFLDNFCIGDTYSSVVYPTGDAPVAEQPTITPRSGTYLGATTVTLAAPTPGSTIYYTTDGSTPSVTHGTVYTAPFSLSTSARVQAIATVDGKFDSAISAVDYEVRVHWTGAAADLLWSTSGNWDPSCSPAHRDLVFNNTNTTSNAATVNNIVDSDFTVSSLSYTNTGNYVYHVTRIDPGKTLTINASKAPETALFVGRTATESKKTYTRVCMMGGGALVVDAPAADVLITKRSSSDYGEAHLDLSGLSATAFTVKNFMLGVGDRGKGFLTLAATNSLVAERLCVGDSGGSSNGDTSKLTLGEVNRVQADQIALGAYALNTYNENRGEVVFASGLVNPTLSIRGSAGGTSRAALSMGCHGDRPNSWDSTRSISGVLDTRGGTLDARLSTLVLSQGQGKDDNRGSATGTLRMDAGLVDAESVVLGSSMKGKNSANGAKGVLEIAGGKFVAGSMTCADNISESQNVAGELTISQTGLVEINGPVVMGSRSGAANVTVTFNLNGGTLVVRDDMAPGKNPTNVVVSVSLNGAAFIVTNAAETATLRIENGTFAIAGGTAELDRLVTTNALCTTQVELRGTEAGDSATVSVNDSVNLGGTLSVALADGFTPSGGELWKIVTGARVRTGAFAVEDIPEGFRVVYTPDGYWLVNPASATLLLVR